MWSQKRQTQACLVAIVKIFDFAFWPMLYRCNIKITPNTSYLDQEFDQRSTCTYA
jgi:hypothetical protein